MKAWENFIALLNKRQPIKDGHKNFIGSIAKYAKLYREANPQQDYDALFNLLRGTGHMTRDQCHEVVELLQGRFCVQPQLAVFFESMPESNDKRNWTVVVHAADKTGLDLFTDGIQIIRTEYYDRARYEADCAKYLLGLIKERPCIIDYDGDLLEPPK